MKVCDVPERTEKTGKGFVAKMTCIEPGMRKLMLVLDNVPLFYQEGSEKLLRECGVEI